MDRERFWLLLEKNKCEDTQEMLSGIARDLSALSEDEIMMFRGYLSAYMEHVNDCIWVDMACKVINGYVSDDTGLYFALWLIAQGEAVLSHALTDPDSLAELPSIPFGNAEFELLMGVGMEEAADLDLGRMDECFQKCEAEIAPMILYKDGDKYGGYDDFDDAMEDIPSILPKLIERAEREGFPWRELYEL